MAKKEKEPVAVEVPVNEYAAFYFNEAFDPLTRRYGVGAHGYVSTQVVAKRGYGLKKVIPTAKGYNDNTQDALKVIRHVVDVRLPLHETHECETTANRLLAGVCAVLELMVSLEEIPKTIGLLLPRKVLAQFLSNGFRKCVEKGYKDDKGNPIPFKELLDRYIRNHDILVGKGTAITVHCFGQDVVMGHYESMVNANDAVIAGIKTETGQAEPSCIISEPEGYWNHDHGRHPLLAKSRMVFRMLQGEVVENEFLYLMDFEKTSKKKEQTHKLEMEVGQLLPSASYAVVRVNQLDPIVYQVAKEHSQYLKVKYERLAVLFLDAVFKPGAHSIMSKVGTNYLHSRTVVTDLIDGHGTMYTHELHPARQAYRAWNIYLDMESHLGNFLALPTHPVVGQYADFMGVDGPYTATNITPDMIEVIEDSKGKKTYRPTRKIETPNTSVKVKGFYVDEEGVTEEAEVNLSIGIDMPKRNAIAGMAGEQTRVYLLLRQDTAFTVRHFVVVTNGDECGIWTAPFANRTFVKTSR